MSGLECLRARGLIARVRVDVAMGCVQEAKPLAMAGIGIHLEKIGNAASLPTKRPTFVFVVLRPSHSRRSENQRNRRGSRYGLQAGEQGQGTSPVGVSVFDGYWNTDRRGFAKCTTATPEEMAAK